MAVPSPSARRNSLTPSVSSSVPTISPSTSSSLVASKKPGHRRSHSSSQSSQRGNGHGVRVLMTPSSISPFDDTMRSRGNDNGNGMRDWSVSSFAANESIPFDELDEELNPGGSGSNINDNRSNDHHHKHMHHSTPIYD